MVCGLVGNAQKRTTMYNNGWNLRGPRRGQSCSRERPNEMSNQYSDWRLSRPRSVCTGVLTPAGGGAAAGAPTSRALHVAMRMRNRNFAACLSRKHAAQNFG